MAKVRIVDVPRGEFFGGAGAAVWRPSRDKLTGRSLPAQEPAPGGRVLSCENSLLELLERVHQAQLAEARVETVIQQGPAYELSVAITTGSYGYHLEFFSFVPTARRPENQVRLRATLTRAELRALHQVISNALQDEPVHPSRSSGEPAKS